MTASLLLVLLLQVFTAPSPATSLRPDDLRVASVGYRLSERGVAYCPEPYPLTGMLLHHLVEYDDRARAIEIERHGLHRGPGVLASVADSPAARAGIEAGDLLLAVNGRPLPDPRAMLARQNRVDWRSGIEATEGLIEAALMRGHADFQIMRAGKSFAVRVRSVAGCPARVRLAQSNQANAFATGTHVVITTRILAALGNDDELAIIIAHELAHNILHHKDRLEARGGRRLGTREAEREADRLGLQLAFAAGYDVHAAIPMWRSLHARFGGGGLFDSHPSLKARERLIRATIEDLETGRSN